MEPDWWNLVNGEFGWDADHDDDVYLDGTAFLINGAIAECMDQLAMDSSKAKAWSRGSVSYTQYDLLEMAKYHRKLASGMTSRPGRRVYRKYV